MANPINTVMNDAIINAKYIPNQLTQMANACSVPQKCNIISSYIVPSQTVPNAVNYTIDVPQDIINAVLAKFSIPLTDNDADVIESVYDEVRDGSHGVPIVDAIVATIESVHQCNNSDEFGDGFINDDSDVEYDYSEYDFDMGFVDDSDVEIE